MTPEHLTVVQIWAVYLGLAVTTSVVLSSMLFALSVAVKSVFYWRYNKVAVKVDIVLAEVSEINQREGGNKELALLSEVIRATLNPNFLSQDSIERLKLELGLVPQEPLEDEQQP